MQGRLTEPVYQAAGEDHCRPISWEQDRRLRGTVPSAGTDRGRLRLSCFRIGGEAGEFEVGACLHHCLAPPRPQRDLPARAAHGIRTDPVPGPLRRRDPHRTARVR